MRALMPLILVAAALWPAAAQAQDLPPAIDLTELARGQVLSATMQGYADRGYARRGATQRQIAACAQKGRFRAEYGAAHPKVRQLYRLCRGIGR